MSRLRSADFYDNEDRLEHVDEVVEFFKPQLDFEQPQQRRLVLNQESLLDKQSIKCPYCECEIHKGDEKREIILSETDKTAKVRVEIKDPVELLSAAQLFDGTTSLFFAEESKALGYEELCLDENGTTTLSLIDGAGNFVNSIDITEERLPNDICFHLFSSQERIKSFLLDF